MKGRSLPPRGKFSGKNVHEEPRSDPACMKGRKKLRGRAEGCFNFLRAFSAPLDFCALGALLLFFVSLRRAHNIFTNFFEKRGWKSANFELLFYTLLKKFSPAARVLNAG